MTEKRFTVFKSKLTGLFVVNDNIHEFQFEGVENASTIMKLVGLLNNYIEENKELKQFIQELTTKGTGRIDLADGYSYNVSAVLTNWKGDVE